MERWLRHLARGAEAPPEDLPMALAVEGPHGPVIHATNRAAEAEGVHAGARVVDMRALLPTLRVDFADTGGDAAALARLVLWARRWCPWTAGDGLTSAGGAGLVLDTTGSDHLWGGEAAMLAEIEGALAVAGFTARAALAPTRGAAWALARFGGVREVCPAGAVETRLAPLPVRALRLEPATVQTLNRLGLKTIGDLLAVPRLSLARRFSREAPASNPLLRLDQATGRTAEPVDPPEEPPRFSVQTRLPEPVEDPVPHLPALARELCAGLAEAGHGLRRAVLTVYRTDGEVASVTVATSAAMRDPAHLVRLFDGRLDRLDPGFGFDLVTLDAALTEAMDQAQPGLAGEPHAAEAVARLVDRLSGRFGGGSLLRPAPRARHVPERAEGWSPAMAGALPPRLLRLRVLRPLRLLEPPEEVRVLYAVPEGPPAQFVWRRQTLRVSRYDGPERIAPEWWADRPGTRLRDYYRIEDHLGRRWWLYRAGVEGDGRGTSPEWFLHGVFP
nr:DNA polymerase Y family protein [Wenxinia marina]